MKTKITNTEFEKLPADSFEIRFRFSDGGRSLSARPREKNDCTVKSLALVCGVGYDEARRFLARNGRRQNDGFEYWNAFLDRQTEIFGHRLVKHSFPARKGERRMRLDRFLKDFPAGRFILTFADHVAPVVEGVVLDEVTDYFKRVIYTAYEFERGRRI